MATITEKGINIKSFWKFIKAFLTNKDLLGSNDISLGKENVVTTNVKALASKFNKHYINLWRELGEKRQRYFKNVIC